VRSLRASGLFNKFERRPSPCIAGVASRPQPRPTQSRRGPRAGEDILPIDGGENLGPPSRHANRIELVRRQHPVPPKKVGKIGGRGR
jgi:hypothetical protein